MQLRITLGVITDITQNDKSQIRKPRGGTLYPNTYESGPFYCIVYPDPDTFYGLCVVRSFIFFFFADPY